MAGRIVDGAAIDDRNGFWKGLHQPVDIFTQRLVWAAVDWRPMNARTRHVVMILFIKIYLRMEPYWRLFGS